jgi:hypothetical protein
MLCIHPCVELHPACFCELSTVQLNVHPCPCARVCAAEPARASSTPEPKPILLTEQQQMEVYDVLHNSHKQHSEAQKEAVALAAAAPVMLLTGAAGCGKTFTTKTIVQLWRMRVSSSKEQWHQPKASELGSGAAPGGRGAGGGAVEQTRHLADELRWMQCASHLHKVHPLGWQQWVIPRVVHLI